MGSGISGRPLLPGDVKAEHLAQGAAASNIGEGGVTLSMLRAEATPVLTKYYKSAEQTITPSGQVQINHALGVIPKAVQVKLICKVAQLGYAVGDVVAINQAGNDPADTAHRGISVVLSSGQVVVRYGSSAVAFAIIRADSGNAEVITTASWRMIVEVFA